MIQKSHPSYNATIFVGLRRRSDGYVHSIDKVEEICQAYCDEIGLLCVTVTPTRFIYTDGAEPGAAVGFIHYPRYPADTERVKTHALELGRRLKQACDQLGLSVVLPDETFWFAEDEVQLESEPTDLK